LQHPITASSIEEDTMKVKLICALTTVALFALPVADAFAGHYA
jgi:hypothetical protein